jgi:hypothetical protein
MKFTKNTQQGGETTHMKEVMHNDEVMKLTTRNQHTIKKTTIIKEVTKFTKSTLQGVDK